jgi:ABC-type polysaccharide/polyol phosphate export permease
MSATAVALLPRSGGAAIDTMSDVLHHYTATQRTTLAEEWQDIVRSWHLLYSLVWRDLTVRYKRSFLGWFWTMLHPLLLTIILTVVFSAVFRFTVPHYEVYVLSALLPWTFISQTTVTSMAAIAWNGGLMKRVRVPKSIFVLSATIAGIVNLALAYVPLLAIMLLRGVPIRPAIAFLPVSLAIVAVFTFGLSLALSATAVYFLDLREMYGVALTVLMYLTPIIYPISIIPQRFRLAIDLNPFMYLIDVVRLPVYFGVIPPNGTLAIASGAAVVSLLAGWAIFRRLSRGFYPYL